MLSIFYLFYLVQRSRSFMTKRFKCNVKKIKHVAVDFIHFLMSFLACTSQCSKHSHFFIYAYAFRKYLPYSNLLVFI